MIKVRTVKPKLLDQVRHATRVRHLCPRSQALPGNALHEGGSKARSPNVLKRFDYKIIIIAKRIVACVVGRINIDEFYFILKLLF